MLLFTTPWNSLNLSRLFHCSVIKVLCFVVVLGDSLFIISYQVCFVKNFFSFFENFFQSVLSDPLSQTRQLWYFIMCCFVCQEFFCFILEIFPKSCCPLSNHVLSSGQLDYNTTRILFCQPFFNTFSLASEQQRLNFTLLWHLVLPKSWFSKWNSFFNPQHTSFFFCLLRLYAFSASIRHFWCQIGQVLHKWPIYVLTAFNQPHRKRY